MKTTKLELKAVVRDYMARFRPLARAERESFQRQPFAEAVERAAWARRSDGSRHDHHRRREERHLEAGARRLAEHLSELESCPSFAALHGLCERLLGGLQGLGPLYIYDTALGIGSKKGTLPQRVYLHSGTRDGAKALGLDARGEFLDTFELPAELRELEPYEVEDLLCIYKKYFIGEVTDLAEIRGCCLPVEAEE